MPFHQFFLDFAWPDKRLCIEVDGNQHLMPERKAKDEMKDEMLDMLCDIHDEMRVRPTCRHIDLACKLFHYET